MIFEETFCEHVLGGQINLRFKFYQLSTSFTLVLDFSRGVPGSRFVVVALNLGDTKIQSQWYRNLLLWF